MCAVHVVRGGRVARRISVRGIKSRECELLRFHSDYTLQLRINYLDTVSVAFIERDFV